MCMDEAARPSSPSGARSPAVTPLSCCDRHDLEANSYQRRLPHLAPQRPRSSMSARSIPVSTRSSLPSDHGWRSAAVETPPNGAGAFEAFAVHAACAAPKRRRTAHSHAPSTTPSSSLATAFQPIEDDADEEAASLSDVGWESE